MEDPYDDNQSDSGVSADFSAEVSGRTPASDSPEPRKPPPPPPNETPIEREIRLAAEREQSLRQARGLSTSDRGAEFVEIPARRVPLLSRELPPSRAVKDKGKERQFAGKKMQREISQETQREQDLVQLGRVQGGYEKGTVRQLRERKLLFEAFQQSFEVPASPRKGSLSAGDLFAGLGGGAPGDDDDSSASSSACGSERRHSLELLSSSVPSARGPGLSEGTGGQIIIMEGQHVSQMPLSSDADRTPHAAPGPGALAEAQALTVVDSPAPPYVEMEQEEEEAQEEEEVEVNSVMVRENPFFKLRSSMSMRPQVERDIRQAQERERELRKQRSSLYQGAAGAEAPNAHNGLLGPHTRSSTASVIRPQTDTAHREQTEAQKSPPGVVRTPRQKSSLVQRWEAGMVNGQED